MNQQLHNLPMLLVVWSCSKRLHSPAKFSVLDLNRNDLLCVTFSCLLTSNSVCRTSKQHTCQSVWEQASGHYWWLNGGGLHDCCLFWYNHYASVHMHRSHWRYFYHLLSQLICMLLVKRHFLCKKIWFVKLWFVIFTKLGSLQFIWFWIHG